MIFLVSYLTTAFALAFMSRQMYAIPFFGNRLLVIGNPMASFLWPIGLVLTVTNGLFGLFETKSVDDIDEEDKK